jgi:hypothetical protein
MSGVRVLLIPKEAALRDWADQMGGPDPAAAKKAKAEMEQLVHLMLSPAPGKDWPEGSVRARVADSLAEIARSDRPRVVRAHAIHLLGFAASGRRDEDTLKALEKDPQVGDDARMARERMKGSRY